MGNLLKYDPDKHKHDLLRAGWKGISHSSMALQKRCQIPLTVTLYNQFQSVLKTGYLGTGLESEAIMRNQALENMFI